MKVLLIDAELSGHHIPYLKAILDTKNNNNVEYSLLVPKNQNEFDVVKYEYKKEYDYRKPLDYLAWIREVKRIVKTVKPDVIHFLYGDVFYRHFALSLGWLKNYKTIVTFHQFRRTKLVDISLKKIFSCITYGVVHTKYLKTGLNNIGINNISHIEYPQLYNFDVCDEKSAKDYYKLSKESLVLGTIGETKFYKGFDLLLEALGKVNTPFQLLIAGKPGYYDAAYIKEHTKEYSHNVKTHLRFLSDEEFVKAISASDYIVLPYRKRFDGASGPLTEAVWAKKPVIAANHGSLGDIVETNKLGYTFTSEDVSDLARVIESAFNSRFRWNQESDNYRNQIMIGSFQKSYMELYL